MKENERGSPRVWADRIGNLLSVLAAVVLVVVFLLAWFSTDKPYGPYTQGASFAPFTILSHGGVLSGAAGENWPAVAGLLTASNILMILCAVALLGYAILTVVGRQSKILGMAAFGGTVLFSIYFMIAVTIINSKIGLNTFILTMLPITSVLLALLGMFLVQVPLKRFFINIKKNRMFLFMLLPGAVYLIIFSYIPMPGVVMAFQRLPIGGSFVQNILRAEFVGLKNFTFFFQSIDAPLILRNTVLYNLVFMALGLVAAVFVAIAANEIYSRRAMKFYQTVMILPAFLSWVIVSYLIYSILEPNFGTMNGLLKNLGLPTVSWYQDMRPWPFLIPFMNLWKGVGLGSIYYFAAINGIDQEMYESAWLDGASRFKQIIHITLPMLKTTMIILTILSMGSIIKTDFGLFFVGTLQMGKGALYDVASTLDTYVFGTIQKGRFTLGAASGLFQSVVGMIMILGVNAIVRKIDRDSAMF